SHAASVSGGPWSALCWCGGFPYHRGMRQPIRFACCLILALLLAACGGAPRREAPPEAAATAESLYREGQFARAADAFMAAADASRARRNYYRLRAAEAW